MKIKTKFTEKQIFNDVNSEYSLISDAFSFCGYIDYKLSEGEKQWLKFVTNRYSIADYIIKNTNYDTGYTRFYPLEFSKILDEDCKGFGKAVCLSDETALQAIFFYGYNENCIEE